MGVVSHSIICFLLCILLVDSFKCGSNRFTYKAGYSASGNPLMMSSVSLLDSRELTKIFGRMAAKSILLDIPGAGTPEMASCCHGGCDNCNYSHSFDNLSAGRAKWVPTYFTRTLIDGRSETAPWAGIFDSSEDIEKSLVRIDKATFRERLQKLPYELSMGPGTTVSADEIPNDGAAEAFWDILLAALIEIGDVDIESKSTYLLSADKVPNVVI